MRKNFAKLININMNSGEKLRSLEKQIKEKKADNGNCYNLHREYDNVVRALKSVPGQLMQADFYILHKSSETPEVSTLFIS